MGAIRQLSETLVSQIKAGEVIERPASALKELMENAIDSGATQIKVAIDKGGLSRILVEDDGEGIDPADLPLAFARHATSKIFCFEDLLKARTMGFRGEALASIASVSKASIVSKKAGMDAHEIAAEEGRIGPVAAANRQDGTTVAIHDLFFYVPARRKFLRSESTESAHCREAFIRAALSRPDIAMSFSRDGKQLHRLPAQTALDRAKALLGPALSGSVAMVGAQTTPYAIHGFAAPVGALPTGRETQFLFVNKRFARDKLLSHAAKEALVQSRGAGRERDVAFVLFLELPTELVDANAHPAKTEVRFKDPRAAHQFIYKALSEALATLPPPPPAPADPHRPLSSMPSEDSQDLFGEPSSGASHASPGREVSNEAERFVGPLRSGLCGWDAGDGLWVAPFQSLAIVGRAFSLSSQAESGELSATQLLIPPMADGLVDWREILTSRSKQLLALGVELEWTEPGSCRVLYAPEGFDNCDWHASLACLGRKLADSKTDALSLSVALCSGLDEPALGSDGLWDAAQQWMGARRLARELPHARFIPLV